MVEVLKSFEEVSGWLEPVVLVGPGVVMLAVGLFAWLAGLCVPRVVLGLLGATAGLLAGFYWAGLHTPEILALSTAGGAAFGGLLPRLAVGALLAALGVAIAFVAIGRSQANAAWTSPLDVDKLDPATQQFPVRDSLEIVRGYGHDMGDRVVRVSRSFIPLHWAILASAGSGLVTLGALFRRMAGALACGATGAVLVVAGLVLLLMAKGAAPVAQMEKDGAFYGLIVLGMAGFGAIEQLCLCKPPEPREPEPRGRRRGKEKESRGAWRGR
jgi:hypothetical protein